MEECLLAHDSLSEAIVVGLNDDLKGQLPYGVIVLKDGVDLEKEIIYKQLV
jgi:propionyl-CoA synthetase